MRTIDNINDLNKSDFLSIFGNVFEKTESVALEAFESKPFKNFEVIMFNMLNIYESYKKDKILEILNAHPELAVAKKMTSESISEQASAKLNECSNEEYEEFKRLNSEYKKKFNFPFIIAVKSKNKNEILNNFRQRISNNINDEFLEAKKQVKKIATFRLNEIINK
ncbi:2-oxo-4-hydroxy-4-carboxy-5-ureidoimidazoline decarboxylase [Candidatus Pelagibacter sp.]|nr:2-oxo-4-hydroxy-4-carboxy-5-ureidoimidazoline decarboxylase [Candidatus Pelagibacter sp.]